MPYCHLVSLKVTKVVEKLAQTSMNAKKTLTTVLTKPIARTLTVDLFVNANLDTTEMVISAQVGMDIYTKLLYYSHMSLRNAFWACLIVCLGY